MTGKITATDPDPDPGDGIVYDRKLALKNSAPCISSFLKSNSRLVEDAQDLDVVMPMYNLLYY